MMKNLILLCVLTIGLTACTKESAYTIDNAATEKAPWKIGDIISEDRCLGRAYNTLDVCYRKFLGITTKGLMLVQNFHPSQAKATDPYLVSDASTLASDPAFKIDGVFTAWYTNGQKAIEVTYQDGRPQGVSLEWYETGEQAAKSHFKNGQEQGVSTIWHRNGHKHEESHYQNGQYDGLWTIWYDDGQKAMEGCFSNGQRQGLWTVWHKNGKKAGEGHYLNGEEQGEWTHWDESGNPISEESHN